MRVNKTDALDHILDALGSQGVPPDFYQTSEASSLFGSQHSDDEGEPRRNGIAIIALQNSPSDTVRISASRKARLERRNWKTLRDFVDDQAIEDVLETMDHERAVLEVSACQLADSKLINKTPLRTSLVKLTNFLRR